MWVKTRLNEDITLEGLTHRIWRQYHHGATEFWCGKYIPVVYERRAGEPACLVLTCVACVTYAPSVITR